MAQLVLKGHSTRGKEVINLLKTLGANSGYIDTFVGFYYYIECGSIRSSDVYPTHATIFTLEEFLEKYPYKVGDEVEYKSIGDANLKSKIIYMEWCNSLNKVLYTTEDAHVISTENITETKSIPPYMDYDIKEDKAKAPDLKGEDYSGRRFGYKIPNGYEFECVRKNEIILKPIKPQYPTTYEECCEVLGISRYDVDIDLPQPYQEKMFNLFKLRICYDAYCKIAGEQMGLDKPWEPDWDNLSTNHEFIKINKGCFTYSSRVLVFPTAEMRDEFYKNFKDLIESCKKLL